MNLLKSPLRRTTAAIAGAFIGLVGAVALQAPASAHWGNLTTETKCADGGGWAVQWKINTFDTGNLNGDISELNVTPGGSELKAIKNGDDIVAANQSLAEWQTFPNSVSQVVFDAKVSWTPENGQGWSSKLHASIDKKADCADKPDTPETPPTKPTTPATPETPATPGEPTPIVEFDCDTMTIGLDNPKDGVKITLTLETSKGEKRELTVKPGEKKTEKFSATPGFTVKVGAKEVEETTTIEFTKPDDCAAAGAGGGDELAHTGANASTVAGAAGAVLLIGAALFFVARRRKIKFTA